MSPRASRSRSPSGSRSSTDADESDDEDGYERRRRENMLLNQKIMAELSLSGGTSQLFSFSQQSTDTTALSYPRPAPRKRARKTIYDRNGYILSRPEGDERYTLACVEVTADRRTQKMIADGEYADCTWLAVGEARRWRFGDGAGVLEEGEEPGPVDGVADTFRWKLWEDACHELGVDGRSPTPASDSDSEIERRPTPVPEERIPRGPKVPYSEIQGATCHQCKRKSNKPKLRCRNPGCEREFCWTCCKRYEFKFDQDDRSWMCPFCLDTCNCGACRKSRGQEPLSSITPFGRNETKIEAERHGVSLQTLLGIKEAPARKPTFDRIRLVDKDTDIVSPPLSKAWEEYLAALERPKVKPAVPRKRRKPKPKPEGEGEEGEGDAAARGKAKKKRKSNGDAASARTTEDTTNGTEPKKVKKQKKAKPSASAPVADPEAEPTDPDADPSEDPTANGTVPRIKLIIPARRPIPQCPPPKEVDSDGETVHGYSDEEVLPPASNILLRIPLRRSRSTSTDSEESAGPSTNEFLARQFGGAAVGEAMEVENGHTLEQMEGQEGMAHILLLGHEMLVEHMDVVEHMNVDSLQLLPALDPQPAAVAVGPAHAPVLHEHQSPSLHPSPAHHPVTLHAVASMDTHSHGHPDTLATFATHARAPAPSPRRTDLHLSLPAPTPPTPAPTLPSRRSPVTPGAGASVRGFSPNTPLSLARLGLLPADEMAPPDPLGGVFPTWTPYALHTSAPRDADVHARHHQQHHQQHGHGHHGHAHGRAHGNGSRDLYHAHQYSSPVTASPAPLLSQRPSLSPQHTISALSTSSPRRRPPPPSTHIVRQPKYMSASPQTVAGGLPDVRAHGYRGLEPRQDAERERKRERERDNDGEREKEKEADRTEFRAASQQQY